MSENKNLSPEEIKLQEDQDRNKKSLLKAKSETGDSKAKLIAAGDLLIASKGDAKAEPDAVKAHKAAEADFKAKVDAEMAARIKYAQSGAYVPSVEKEKGLYHVKLEKVAFAVNSGKRLSKPHIQMFTPAEWNTFSKNSSGLGYTIEVMWNPAFYKL